MARYIVRSRTPLQATAATRQCRMRPADRVKQIAEVKKLRKGERISETLGEWMNDNVAPQAMAAIQSTSRKKGGKATRQRTRKPRRTPAPMGKGLTGSYVLDLEADQAARLTADVPGVSVIEDRPLTLIYPISSSSASAELDNQHKPWLWVHEMVRATVARNRGVTGDGVLVGVLDTGIDSRHGELEGRVVGGVELDVERGTWAEVHPLTDTATHGTHVAGIIAGANVGCAPGARLAGAVMIPGGNGWISDFLLALDWAASTPAIQIVNMSAGLQGFYPDMIDAVREVVAVGLLPVIAVGNEGRNSSRSPGNYDAPLSVGACDRNRRVASFSGGGTVVYQHQQYSLPDLVAPGVSVYSCVPGGGYAYKDGTSMATPVVSGIAALLLEHHPTATVPDLIDAIIATCDDLSVPNLVVSAERQGSGVVNCERAMSYLS